MHKLDDLEQYLKSMITSSYQIESICDFCQQFSGREKLTGLHVEYCKVDRVSLTYFREVVSGNYTTYKVGHDLWVDFDIPLGDINGT